MVRVKGEIVFSPIKQTGYVKPVDLVGGVCSGCEHASHNCSTAGVQGGKISATLFKPVDVTTLPCLDISDISATIMPLKPKKQRG